MGLPLGIQKQQLQAPPDDGTIQRQSESGVASNLNITVMRHSEGSTSGGTDVTQDVEQGIQQAKGGGQGLDESIKEPMEKAFGADFSGVKVHTDAQSDKLNHSIQAKAFTTGQDIFFKQGEYNPGSKGGQELLAHELTHVVQQTGAVQAKETTNTSPSHYQKETQQKNSPVLESQQSPTIQKLEQKIEEQAPSGTMSIRDFIKLVEQEEAQYPKSNTNTKLMITRLRKIFYDTDGWNNKLIPGTSDIKPRYTTKPQEYGSYTIDPIPFSLEDDIHVIKNIYTVQDSRGQTPEIAKHQNIKLEDGSYLDIGHLLAGLDALNHPAPVSALGISIIDSNVDAATWVGDLGSVLAEFELNRLFATQYTGAETSLTEKKKQDLINYYASSEDMLGNIDAYVVGAKFEIAASQGKKVSAILREYYLGEKINPDATEARKNRYSRFASNIGLELQSRNPAEFSNETTWVKYYATQVSNAAALYILVNTLRDRNGIYLASALSGDNEGGEVLVQLFVNALRKRIEAEPDS